MPLKIVLWLVAVSQFAMGFFVSFFFISTTALYMSAVPQNEAANAADIASFVHTMSKAFGTAIMTTT